MTSARTSLSVFAVAIVACTAAACSAEKDGQTVIDAASEGVPGRPQISVSPSSLNWGLVCPGDTSAPQTLQVTNVGDAAASVELRIVADDPTEFIVTPTGCALIAPGAACTVAVVLVPKTMGPKLGTLVVASESTGQKATIALTNISTGGPAPFSLSPSQLEFGSETVGTVSPAMRVTLTKHFSTREPCSLDPVEPRFTVTLSGDEFVITNDTCSTSAIPIGGTCMVEIAMRPTTAGDKRGALEISGAGTMKTVSLRGTAVSVVDAPKTVDAGPWDSGRDSGQDISLDAAIDASCVRPLSEFSVYCPQDYSEIEKGTVSCMTYEVMEIGECASDHLLMFRRLYGTHTVECFYDPQSRRLTAAIFMNDTPVCGDSRMETTSPTKFCQAPCVDRCEAGANAPVVHLETIRNCCQGWPYPIPGCPTDASATH